MKTKNYFSLLAIGFACLMPLSLAQKATQTVKVPVAGESIKSDAQIRKIVAYPYEPLKSISDRLKVSSYSMFENPTGIFFPQGEKVAIHVRGLGEEKLELLTFDFSQKNQSRKIYELKEGVNEIEIEKQGLGYISYYTPNYETAPSVEVSIKGGKFNGVFEREFHNNEDWKRILEAAVYPVIDIQGRYVHCAFPVEDLKKFCPNKGRELIEYYDNLIYSEQDLMGINKYGERPKNRMSGRVMYRGYMHADGIGAAFVNTSMNRLLNEEKGFTQGVWAVSHEFGHVNQIRPGLTWSGTIECTTNMFSCWNNYLYAPGEMRLEHEAHGDSRGSKVKGGRFNAYLNEAIVAGKPWLFQNGPNGEPSEHFVKICPLWQIQLYFAVAEMGNKDVYKDAMYKIRKTDYSNLSSGEIQMQFIKHVCDSAKQDLTIFFHKAGMLSPVDATINDYGDKSHIITEELIKQTVDSIKSKGYEEPQSPVLYYITSLNAHMFRNRKSVEGQYEYGVQIRDFELKGKEFAKDAKEKALIISSEVWKNVVAFETYKGNKLERVAIFGTDGDENLSSTRVQYPEGATRVEAVSWDGQRTLVYGKR